MFLVFHGFGGRIHVNDIEVSQVPKIMTKAFDELGIKRRDTNGRSQYGESICVPPIEGDINSKFVVIMKRKLHDYYIFLK